MVFLLTTTVTLMTILDVVKSQHLINTFEVSNSAFQVGGYDQYPCACVYDDFGDSPTIDSGSKTYSNDTHDFVSYETETAYTASNNAALLTCDQECKCEYADVDDDPEVGNPYTPNGTSCTIISTTEGNIPLSPFDGSYEVLYDVSGAAEVSYVCPKRVGTSSQISEVRGSFLSQATFTPTGNENGKPLIGIKFTNPQDDIIYIKTDETCTCIGAESCNVIETSAPSFSPSESPPTPDTSNAAVNMFGDATVISKMILVSATLSLWYY